MPLLINALIGALQIALGSFIGRALLALGLSYVTYSGFNIAMDQVMALVRSNMNSIAGQVGSFLAWCWIDKAIAVIFSAYTAALAIKMAGSTTIKKMVLK